MSLCCGVECVVIIGFARWVWKRCAHISGHDSANWTLVAPEEFEPIPRMCRLVLAVYETDLHNPQFSPQHGYRLNPDWVIKRVTYEQTQGRAPPYLIYTDHEHKEIVLAVRGLNLYKESDYKTLLDNRLGMQMFDGGFVHHGLLKSAVWLLNAEGETLKRLWEESGKEYGMVFAGHSLGSGVVSLLTVIVVNHRDKLGGVPREKIRCYAMAPARCMSLNLAVKYADVIHSVILQDDFLPRTATPLEDVFKSIFWLLALLVAFGLFERYIHSRRCGRFPPEVRTAIPVDGRAQLLYLLNSLLTVNANDFPQKMKEIDSGTITTPPKVQKLERMRTIEQELRDALERAVSLNIPYAVTTPDVEPLKDNGTEPSLSEGDQASQTESTSTGRKTNWDEVVKKLFRKSESGNLVLNKEVSAPNHNTSIDQPS
ncbi:hypothetical protein DKX38_027361 [Salix brachista]|uniref:Fungal lipase-like domain-containing protein n=1 Tax=Salix brachista TaxID=2182728 RepID=A0A5N5JGY7_9ROSI|nr:hypothetical protein DKX38_027361 [Salix brachista]